MTQRELIRKTIKLIKDPRNWTQGVYYDDNCAWCMAGAMKHIINEDPQQPWKVYEKVTMKFSKKFKHSVIGYNDNHTHAEVLAALRSMA